MSRVEDVEEAHADALEVNRRRDRLTRWYENGGLSWDPMRRLQADAMLRIEESIDDPRNLIRITGIS